jgi:hypothetical protein
MSSVFDTSFAWTAAAVQFPLAATGDWARSPEGTHLLTAGLVPIFFKMILYRFSLLFDKYCLIMV